MTKKQIYIFPVFIGLLFISCKEKQKVYTVGVSQCSEDEWRQKMNIEMQHEVMLYPDIRLDIKSVTDDTEKQITDIQGFIDRKVDLIVVAPNKAAPVTPIVEKAYNAGISVILVDRKTLSNRYTAFIGADNYQIGKDAGSYMAQILNGKGSILEICGLEGSSPATERHQGFISVINNYENIKLLSSVDAAWLKDLAENKMEEALSRFSDIDVVYAHNDRMAMGAYNAALQQNREKNIAFIGIDALPGVNGGVEQVINGKLKASFIYPTSGEKIIQLAADILHERPFEKDNLLYTNIVDNTNARMLKLQTDAIIEQENKISFLNSQIDNYMTQYTSQRYLLFSAVAVMAFFILFLILLYRAYMQKNRLNNTLEKRNAEISRQKNLTEEQRDQLVALSKQLEEATQAKLVFFTNISHEFRTPLALISGPVNSLLADNGTPAKHRRLLSLAKKNVNVLLELIDQVIDFRKYENGKMKLNCSFDDVHNQLLELNESFCELAKQKKLKFEFNSAGNDYRMYYDSEKMERIYFNLLSNAFKFVPQKGNISVNLDKIVNERGAFAVLRISNSGKEISPDDIQNIFERFYQADSRFAGSGIGLALTKSLVELHGGEILVESNKHLTTFTVVIPFISSNSSEETGHTPVEKADRLEYSDEMEEDAIFQEDIDKNKKLLLVVDDNPDIRTFIKTVLQNSFSIIEAKDGTDGFRKAVKYVPDLIVSDVMMPPPDGVELCRQLKSELSTSHIPLILLTAYSLDEQRIAGFESGADDFIAKPFNADVLEARIKNLIENRQNLKNAFQQSLFAPESKEIPDKVDQSFIRKLKSLIEKNLMDTDFNIEGLGKEIGLSRTQLYRKVKSITGYSPVELQKIIRLKKAHDMLSSTEATVSEVAYSTGFISPSYFAKCFREYYLETPTEYLKKVR